MDLEDVNVLAGKYADTAEGNNIRFEIIGNEAEVQSFDSGYLNELGIDTKKKRLDLVPQDKDIEISDELFIYNSKDIRKRFSKFCDDKELKEKQGVRLLDKILKN